MGEIRGTNVAFKARATTDVTPVTQPLLLRPEVPILMRPGEKIQFGIVADSALILPLPHDIPPGPIFQSLLAAQRGKCLLEQLQQHDVPPDFVDALIADLHDAELVVAPTINRTLTIIGRDSLRTRIYETMRHNRHHTAITARAPSRHTLQWLSSAPISSIGLVVLTGMEVPNLQIIRVLFNRGIAHVSTLFRDGVLTIGPYCAPRQSSKRLASPLAPVSACPVCIENHRVDKDMARSVLALQMRTYVPHTAPEWVAPATSLVVSKLRQSNLSEFAGTQVSVNFDALETKRRYFDPHPRCSVCGYSH